MTAETDLLPCPFCGSAYAPRLRNTHTASFWVSCSDEDGGCGAEASGQFFPGPRRRTRFGYDPEAPEGSKFDARTLDELHPEYRRAAESAIAAWNRRATAAKDAEVEALRAEVAEWKRVASAQAELHGESEARAERLESDMRALHLNYDAYIERLEEALRRYRNEVPLGHQPHMLAHEVDALLASRAALHRRMTVREDLIELLRKRAADHGGDKLLEEAAAALEAAREDAARLDWMDANGFTAYRSIDPIDGLSGHAVVVHETQRPRRGNVADTIRAAIDQARGKGVAE